VDGGGTSEDRRHSGDRREGSTPEARRGAKRGTSRLTYLLRALGTVFVLLGVIIYTVRVTRPVYATRGSIGDELRKRAPEVAEAIAPLDSTAIDQFMATPKFQSEKRNFYQDVMRLKQVDSARADSIAHYAVREAYRRNISPAIIFGVMLTENSRFISKATSNVGAVGLMQVYPKVWLTKEMTKLFGRDLSTDSTNVKYGVFILHQYFRPKDRKGKVRERDWATALLRYNGCVRGTNTPHCHTYPSKVKGFIENQGSTICSGRGFYDCIAKPFIAGLTGATPIDSATRPAAAGASAAPVAIPTPQAALSPGPAAPRPPPVTAAAVIPIAPAVVVAATKKPAVKPTPVKRTATAARTARAKARAKPRAKPKAPVRAKPKPAATTSRPARARDEVPAPPKPITVKLP